jgi:predicted dehydrogenase
MPDKDAEYRRKLSRRNFLKKSSMGTLFGLTGAVEIEPAPAVHRERERRRDEETVNCALIGFGDWGREIADTLGRIPEANLMAVCDNYDVMLRRAERSVPEASRHTDYREVLSNPDVQMVLIATPTHLHREIAVAALEAGKHVYCEAPMASSIDDARAIALAARAVEDELIFQVGQLIRTDPQYRSVFGFVRSGALGTAVMTRMQWHAKESWRRTSPSSDRVEALNWRLDPAVSTGLIGEVGLQQLDAAYWFFQALPVSVSGFGQIRHWNDGREVPDTVQAFFEFPDGMRLFYDATLASSFDAAYELFHGSDSTIMLRDSKGWMFKEVDAPMLGWEVYARKDRFYKEEGIALLANATKLEAQGQDPAADDPNAETQLYHALKAFTDNYFFGPYPPVADYQRGYESAVIALKANEAILGNTTVTFDEASFDLG